MSFGQTKITLLQRHIAQMLKNVHDGDQNVKFVANVSENADDGDPANVPENADDGDHVKFTANGPENADDGDPANVPENAHNGSENVKFAANVPENAHNGDQNVKFAANMLKTVHDGIHVKFAANLDRSCDYVLKNFSACAAIVPLDPEKVLSPANAAVVDMPGRKVLLQACKWGGRKAYVRALARIVK